MFKKIKIISLIILGLFILGTFFLSKTDRYFSPVNKYPAKEEDFFIDGAVSASKKIRFNNRKKIIVEKIINLDKSIANVSIIVHDGAGKPIPNLLVMVYDDNFLPIYDYSILRSDKQGKIDFSLNSNEKFSLIISTMKDREGIAPSFYFIAQLELDTFKTNKVKTSLNLFEVNLFFNNWNEYFFEFPSIKLEAVIVNDLGESQSFEYASNKIDDKKDRITFFVSKGIYRFNVDTMNFDYKRPVSIIAQTKNINVPKFNQINVNFNLFETHTQKVGTFGYGWVKYQNPTIFYGDHQSPFFPENDTLLISNLKKLKQSIVYISLQECIEEVFSEHSNIYLALSLCTDTDIRFDFSKIFDLDRDELLIYAPERLSLYPEKVQLSRGENLKIIYKIFANNNAEISAIYIHQLWDSQILPQFFFYNENGLLVHKKDLFDEKYISHAHPYFEEKICLDEGKYVVEARLPTPLWGEKRELIASFELIVNQGEDCHYLSKQIKSQDFQYQSWQQLYEDRKILFENSSGFLLTFPQYSAGRSIEIDSNIEQVTVNNCADFQLANSAEVIWINITPDLVFNDNKQRLFSECFVDFTKNNSAKNYVLINNYWENRPYPTSNLYIMYYFYLLAHQGLDAEVGVLAANFYDFFYGFPDFMVANSQSLKIIGEQNDRNFQSSLSSWLQNYGDLSPEKIIYASATQ